MNAEIPSVFSKLTGRAVAPDVGGDRAAMRMRWVRVALLAGLSLLSASVDARAGAMVDGRADNPAFCFGFLAALAPAQAGNLAARQADIVALFAKAGPKDSTDERGFDDWQRIGRAAAADSGGTDNRSTATACGRLLGVATP